MKTTETITTQRQNVLRHLLFGPLCGMYHTKKLGRRVPARIHELRSVGFDIITGTCRGKHGHTNHQSEYRLRGGDEELDWCAYCGPLGDWRYVGDDEELSDGLEVVRCARCGKEDYR